MSERDTTNIDYIYSVAADRFASIVSKYTRETEKENPIIGMNQTLRQPGEDFQIYPASNARAEWSGAGNFECSQKLTSLFGWHFVLFFYLSYCIVDYGKGNILDENIC